MAISETVYNKDDFKQAISALLPAGEYWQYEKGDPLDGLLEGLANEFKTIHDETKVNILYSPDNNQTGWKLADYQTILNSNGIAGTVFDDSQSPNLIYLDLSANQATGDLMKTLDAYRLPHTAFCFQYNNKQTLHVVCVRQTLQINRHTMRA